MLSHPQAGGFKSYTTNLVQALPQLDRANQYLLYLDRPLAEPLNAPHSNVEARVVQRIAGLADVPIREQVRIPWRLYGDAVDLVHFPCATGSPLSKCPSVVTIHDALEFIERVPKRLYGAERIRRSLMQQYSRWASYLIARRARVIITDSDHSRADIIRLLGVPEQRVRVIPLAHAAHFAPCRDMDQLKEFKRRCELPDAFVLALVSTQPRKNVLGLLRTYAQLPERLRHDYPLVLAWSHHLLQQDTRDVTERLGVSGDVRHLARVADSDLILLYNAATVFVFPSLYEGFGLPVLEAMACGTPVLASNLTSVPEVAGDAAVLVDPRDEGACATALIELLSNPDKRARLRESGLRRAQQFSWRRTAQMTLDVYREAVRLRPGT